MNYTEMNRPLYKRDTTGNVRVWQMELGWDSEDVAAHRSHTGIKDGAIVTSEWKLTSAKNVGRSNATTAREQAESEIANLYVQRLDRGYFENEADIDTFDKFKPMLAVEYDANKVNFDDEIYSQPKLDGIRCIARKDGLWSRQGKPIVSCPHIEEALKPVFDEHPNAIIDGELYNHMFKDDFNKITSMVRKTKLKPEDYDESRRLVQYHVYDYYDESDFAERSATLSKMNFANPVVYVFTQKISSEDELDVLYADYMENGYEGQMVRLNKEYQNKRSKYLMKRKEFLTDEFKVVTMLEGQGNWAGYTKHFVLTKPDGTHFSAGVRGTQEVLRQLWEDGKAPDWVTLRYFNETPDGIPRFPVVVDWGNGTRED